MSWSAAAEVQQLLRGDGVRGCVPFGRRFPSQAHLGEGVLFTAQGKPDERFQIYITRHTHTHTTEKRPHDLIATVQVVDKLTEIFSPTQSFKNYRAAIRSAKRPGCPYV
jgi:hypothetical protein